MFFPFNNSLYSQGPGSYLSRDPVSSYAFLRRLTLLLLFTISFCLLHKVHQTLALSDLTLGKLVLLTFKRILTVMEFQTYRSTDDVQTLTVVIIQITLVGICQIAGLVTVNDNARRIVTAGMSILELNTAAVG